MRLKITGGRVFDPAHGWQGEVRDLYLDGDRMVSTLPTVDAVIDARDQAVVPGGIDLRGQVATYGLNFLRLWGVVPSPEKLGEAYAILGYTHVHEPYLTLATAAYVHRELAALPVVDVSASLVVNLRDLDLWLRDTNKLAELTETLQFFQEKTRTMNFRVVEPWVRHRQEFYAHRTLPLEEALEVLARLAGELQTTLVVEASPEVLRAALPEPRAFHLAALGAALTADDLAEAALAHLEQGTSADLGLIWPQMVPGGNGVPVQVDLGLCGPLSLAPTAEKGQARRALSLALAAAGTPAAFSGAGAVLAPVEHYPDFFTWLGDREARHEFWGDEVSSRRYSFFEWVGATRTLPARLLGLADRGHLGPGARADVAIFDWPQGVAEDRWPEQVRRCRTLIKAGTVVVDNFRLVRPKVSKDACFRRTGAESTTLVDELCQYRSFRPENLWLLGDLEGAAWVEV
jgi:formylmethanofuran dehydrogenase subunit A